MEPVDFFVAIVKSRGGSGDLLILWDKMFPSSKEEWLKYYQCWIELGKPEISIETDIKINSYYRSKQQKPITKRILNA